MKSNEFNWILGKPCGSKWVPVTSSESKWIQVRPSESKWVQVKPCESRWVQLNSSESKWTQLRPGESTVRPGEFHPPSPQSSYPTLVGFIGICIYIYIYIYEYIYILDLHRRLTAPVKSYKAQFEEMKRLWKESWRYFWKCFWRVSRAKHSRSVFLQAQPSKA